MPNIRQPVYDYGYFNENGDEFVVSLTTAVAEAGGFANATPGSPNFPLHCKMRHIGVVEQTSGARHQIPIAVNGNDLFNDGGTLEFGDETCDVVGKTGELWRLG